MFSTIRVKEHKRMQNYKKMSLEELIVLAQHDDMKAMEELIRREQKNVFTTFSYLTKKREIVADLTQEALLRVARNLPSLKNPKSFHCWLNHIVTNLFYDELRKKERKPQCFSFEEKNNECCCIPDNHCKPNEKCLSIELEKMIKNAILDLPEHFRIAIILRELEGLSYEQIAEATDTTVGTVKSRIARARCKLQDGLKSYI